MSHGFIIRSLTLTGPTVPTAELPFERGLNVIAGPSDTGKTFIAQCIDFAMGSGDGPKEIPEGERYTVIQLKIEANDASRIYTLERGLRGGDIRLSTEGESDRILAAKHQGGRDDTISSFLLGLSGLAEKKVRTNQQGKTRSLSFRDLARLILIDEESIIAATSPILSGQYTKATEERSVFRLLLTGTDDSGVVAKEEPKVVKARQEGKAEILTSMLQQTREQLASLHIAGSAAEVQQQLSSLELACTAAAEELAIDQGNAAAAETRRRNAWTSLRQVESRVDVLCELQKRFELLKQQYDSDLRRLDAIIEAGFRLEQMKEERCPVCGALAEHHDAEHQQERSAPVDVAQACKAEAEKTTTLLRDLEATLMSNVAEIERRTTERDALKAELEVKNSELRTLLQPRLRVALQKVRDCEARRDTCRKALELLQRVHELEAMLAEATAPRKRERAEGPSTTVSSGQAEEFSKEVEALLRSWHFPNLDRVTFSEEAQDIVISGRPRGSHGKGVRAITRAAFNLALLRLCTREPNPKPFPGMLLIDSPLVVYRKPDADEGTFPPDVKDEFYRSLAAEFKDVQVIILENDPPPKDVSDVANCINFTGANHGRRGFLAVT